MFTEKRGIIGAAIYVTLTLVLMIGALLAGARQAFGQTPGPNEGMQVYNGCMQDLAGFGLNCTANDVNLAAATNIVTLDDGCAFLGDTVTFRATFEVRLTTQERYDIGIYFATDGDPNRDGAYTGRCSINTLPYYPNPPWLNLDSAPDICGDIDDAHNPLYPVITITTQCIDPDGDGKLNLPYCTSWRQSGANDLCTSPLNAFPGTPSKCKCESTAFNIDIPVPPAPLGVEKTVDANADGTFSDSESITEPGGSVMFCQR